MVITLMSHQQRGVTFSFWNISTIAAECAGVRYLYVVFAIILEAVFCSHEALRESGW